MSEQLPVRYVDPSEQYGRHAWSNGAQQESWAEPVPAGGGGGGVGGLDLRGILGALKRSYWMLVLAGVIGFAVGMKRAEVQAPVFRASGVIQFVDQARAMSGGAVASPVMPLVRGTDMMTSQLHVLRSQTVLGAVVDSTGLRLQIAEPAEAPPRLIKVSRLDPDVPDGARLIVTFGADRVSVRLGGESGAAPYGDTLSLPSLTMVADSRPEIPLAAWVVGPRRQAASVVGSRISATPRTGTNLVDLRYTASDPQDAATVLDAVMRAFQQHDASASRQQIDLRRNFYTEQLARSDSLLRAAQAELAEFRRRERLGAVRSGISVIENQRLSLEMRRSEMAADVAMYSGLLEQLEAAEHPGVSPELETFATAPGIMSNPIVSSQFSQLVSHENERRSLTTGEYGLSATAPEIVRLDTLIAITHRSLTRAVRSYLKGLEAVDQRLASQDSAGAARLSELEPRAGAEWDEQRLALQVQTLTAQAERFRSDREQLALAEVVEVGQIQIIDEAVASRVPLQVNRRRTVAMGTLLGLIVGLGAALLREVMNTTIRRREDLEAVLQVPGLAVIPRISGQNGARLRRRRLKSANGTGTAFKPGLVTHSDARSQSAEAFRGLRTNLVFSRMDHTMRTLLVTSANASEGKSTVAANLAITYAQQGARTILVDCDVRHPSLDKVFGVPRRPGLTDWIQARNPSVECVRTTDVEGLWFLPAGAIPSNPVEFLGSDLMKKALAVLQDRFDMVILDTCPVLVAADPLVLGVGADGVVVVVRADQTDRSAAQQTISQLTRVGARVVGVVLNDPDGSMPLYGSYYSSGNYAYYGIEPEEELPTVEVR